MTRGALVVVVAVLVAACAELGEADVRVAREIGDGAVVLHLPIEMTPEEVQGIDSEVGLFRSGSLELGYDLGMYSDPLNHPPEGAVTESIDVAGRDARLVTHDLVDDPGWTRAVAVHVPDIDDRAPGGQARHLTLRFRCADEAAAARARSIVDDVEVR